MIITRTPFRISFFGGGTDYPVWFKEHGGAVLSTSINKYCYITVRHLSELFPYRYRIRYSLQEETQNVHEIQHTSVRECLQFLDFHDKRLEVQHNADLPAMTGLGSSSSFTVGLLNALYALKGKQPTKLQLAEEAIHVERERNHENVGSQDQTVAAFGGLNKIEFERSGDIIVSPLSLVEERIMRLQSHCLLVFTGQSRIASVVAMEQIQNTPKKEKELHQMRQMVDEAISILASSEDNLQEFGKLLDESWRIKQTLSSKITNPIINEMYQTALKAGAWGGKLLGAGGGGFLLIFADPEIQPRIRERLKEFISVPVVFEQDGSRVIYRTPEYMYEA